MKIIGYKLKDKNNKKHYVYYWITIGYILKTKLWNFQNIYQYYLAKYAFQLHYGMLFLHLFLGKLISLNGIQW